MGVGATVVVVVGNGGPTGANWATRAMVPEAGAIVRNAVVTPSDQPVN